MAELFDTKERKEKVITVAVDLEQFPKDSVSTTVEESLDELDELANTAGAIVVNRVIQKRDSFHPGTYIGKGKIEELKALILYDEVDAIICDDELSPAQITNLTRELDVKVLDRTAIILDIFAAHASTSEGKLQVELAQLRYRASRLTGLGTTLSRLGGGIGTRGPGEKKLEMDRRLIKDRISLLNKQLKAVVKNRETMRRQRNKSSIKTVAIVGYTNAGKSTLLNKLTNASVLEEDMLFATLDPTTRALELENGQKFLFTDTVGFISKLPHQLIKAFRSTLEEAKYADMIVHVVDVSNPIYESHMKVVYDTLRELEVYDKPVLTVFNKIDKLATPSDKDYMTDRLSDKTVFISAKNGTGFETMLQEIEALLNKGFELIEKTFPYDEAGKIQLIREYGRLELEEYKEDGIFVKAYIPKTCGFL